MDKAAFLALLPIFAAASIGAIRGPDQKMKSCAGLFPASQGRDKWQE